MSRHLQAFGADTVDRDGLADWPLKLKELGMLVAGWLAIVAVWTAVGLLIVNVLDPGPLGRFDDSIATWFEEQRTGDFNGLTNVGSGFADTINVVGASLALVAILLASWRRWGEVLLLLTALVLEVTSFLAISHLVGRDRPAIDKLDPAPPTSSFPSGHTAAAVALWFGLALILAFHYRHRLARAFFYGAATALVVAVAISRMYRGMHHLTDVAAGAALGAVCLALAVWVVGEGVVRCRAPDDGAADTSRQPAEPVTVAA